MEREGILQKSYSTVRNTLISKLVKDTTKPEKNIGQLFC